MKKLIKITVVVIFVIISILIIIPIAFKGKVVQFVTNTINQNINAVVEFDDINLSLLKSFPNLNIEIENLSITGNEEFLGDTLASIVSTSLIVNLMSVISGDEIDVKKINIHHPRIFLLVNESGIANWDIMKADSTATEDEISSDNTPFKLKLKSYSIINGHVVYNDQVGDMLFEIDGLDHNGSGNFTEDTFTLVTNTTCKDVLYTMGNIPYLNHVTLSAKADIDVDLNSSKYTFKQNEFKVNQLTLNVDGFIALQDEDIEVDVNFSVLNSEFKHFMSMIPGVYREGFENVESSGSLTFKGNVKGIYNETTIPSYNLDLQVINGNFRYPDLAEKLSEVAIDLKINNPDGVTDNTVIRLEKYHMKFGEVPVDAALILRNPVSDPYIDGFVKGSVDLGKIQNMIPLEEGETIEGNILADLSIKGRISSLEKKQYEKFKAEGNFKASNINYQTASIELPVSIPTLELVFNPRNLTVNNFKLEIGNTKLQMNGWIDNLFVYIFNDNELLKATLDIKADVIDINEFYTNDDVSENDGNEDPAVMEVIEIPEYIDFLMTIDASTVYYDNLTLKNLKGNMAIRDRTLGLNDVSFNTLDGTIGMDGIYHTKQLKSPEFAISFTADKLDIQKSYKAFGSIQKLAPIAEKCNGRVSTTFRVQGLLDSIMEPDLNSLAGYGKLSTYGVTVNNFKPLVKAGDVLKMDQLKNPKVSDVNISFNFENGRVTLKPFDVVVGGIKSTIDGNHGFDQTIDYNMQMQIPTSMLGSDASKLMSQLISSANNSGANLSMANEIPVSLKITGTVNDPKITTDLKKSASNVMDNLKDQAKDEFERQKKELEEKARQEIERLKKEAEQKAKDEINKLKDQAKEKAKKEADKLKEEAKEKLLKDAENKLKDLFGKPK